MIDALAINAAEQGFVPLHGLRVGVRHLVRRRLNEAANDHPSEDFLRSLHSGPIALHTDAANEQHYEVPAEFFELALGPALKYSSALWADGVVDLAGAERAMLEATCQRAQLSDGQDVLELGCGWGSLTLYMARQYPNSRITAVSNSAPQRRFISARAPENVQVVTADMNEFAPRSRFDRVVSVEMFEHMRNYEELLRRVATWLLPNGRLFIHIFCHREYAYPFDVEGSDNWMGRYFFTGGIMPSFHLLSRFDRDLVVEDQWPVGGEHYARTARAWRENIEARPDEVLAVLKPVYGSEANRWYHRWRLFFLACEELFGFRGGSEWFVGHYRLKAS